MKKKVYEYIKGNPKSDIHIIAVGIGEKEFDVLKTINILTEEGHVRMERPVPLDLTNDDSCKYSVTYKKFGG